jgi:choline transport protein
MSSLAWLASVTSAMFLSATQIQALINITDSEYAFTSWQYTLLMIGVLLVMIAFNAWGDNILPAIETASLWAHVLGFIITLIPLWVLCSKNSASAVFTEVVNNGGWSNTGAGCLVSQATIMFCILGSDSIVHICMNSKAV